MANDSTGATQKLSALIAEIEAEAYARGQSDARKALLDILGAGGKRATPTGARRGRPGAAAKRRAGGSKRAPRTVRIRPGDNWVRYRFGVYETARMRIRAGDRIRWTANDKRHGLLNGGEAVVLGIDSRRVRFELGGKELSLSRDDRQLRHIDHAWSSTVHAAQGMTRDAAIGVLDTLRRAGRFPGHHRSPSIMTARRRTIPTADRRRGRC